MLSIRDYSNYVFLSGQSQCRISYTYGNIAQLRLGSHCCCSLLTWCIVLIQTQAKQAFLGTENPAQETIKPTPGGKEGSVINNVLVEVKNPSQIQFVNQQLQIKSCLNPVLQQPSTIPNKPTIQQFYKFQKFNVASKIGKNQVRQVSQKSRNKK